MMNRSGEATVKLKQRYPSPLGYHGRYPDQMIISKTNPIPDLIDFVTQWVGDVDKTHRIAKSELPRWIPPPLREIYHRFGGYPPTKKRKREAKLWVPLFSTQDFLIPSCKLQLDENDRFSFVHENQGVFLAATKPNDSDPPVWCQFDDDDPWKIAERRLSKFLTTFCLQEIVFGAPYLACFDSKSGGLKQALNSRYQQLWTNAKWLESRYRYSFFLARKDVIIFQQLDEHWIASTAADYRAVLNPKIKVFDHNEYGRDKAYPYE